MSFIIRPEWIQWASVAAGALYLLTGLLVAVRRIRFARERRLLERLDRGLAEGVAGREAAAAALAAAPLGLVWRLASDSTVPRRAHSLLAEALVRRVGVPALSATFLRERSSGMRRIAALRSLALTGGSEGWRLMAEALRDANAEVAGATVGLLSEIDDVRAGALLVEALQSGRFQRSRIATALESFPAEIPELIAPLLDSDTPAVRFWGAMLIRRYRPTPALTGRLEALAADPDPMIRKGALYALSRLGGPGTEAVVRRCLGDPVPFVRAYAVRALGALGAPRVAETVVPLLADRDWWVRTAVKEVLERAGASIEPAVIPYLSHPDAFARNSAAEVLQNTGGFERMLAEEAVGPADSRRQSILRQLAGAGGARMWDSVLERLPAPAQIRARELLGHIQLSAGA